MKAKVRVVREFRFRLTEQEFSVLQDALYEHSIGGADPTSKAIAGDMRDQINEALHNENSV